MSVLTLNRGEMWLVLGVEKGDLTVGLYTKEPAIGPGWNVALAQGHGALSDSTLFQQIGFPGATLHVGGANCVFHIREDEIAKVLGRTGVHMLKVES